MSKSVCYELECTICRDNYDGETGRINRLRKWEHFKFAINFNGSTAMGGHYRDKHKGDDIPEEGPFKAKILRKCRDYIDRMIWQSIYIRENSPKINVQLNKKEGEWEKNTWDLL